MSSLVSGSDFEMIQIPYKVITKRQTMMAARMAKRAGYNCVPPLSWIKALPASNFNIVQPLAIHHHKVGERCGPHYRCEMTCGLTADDVCLIDLPINFFDGLIDHNPKGMTV